MIHQVILILVSLLFGIAEANIFTEQAFILPEFPPCDSISSSFSTGNSIPSLERSFCAEWNPDYDLNMNQCCGMQSRRGKKKAVKRNKVDYCGDMTEIQRIEGEELKNGLRGDPLTYFTRHLDQRRKQAFCTVNNGFLAFGKMVVPTQDNRLLLKSPSRCLNFGTDALITLLEWTGREVAKKYEHPDYSQVKLVLGHLSAPRGGFIGHLSHTSGQDVDIGFLTAKKGKESPLHFHSQFDVENNWWLMTRILENPYASTKVIFLDRSHIRALDKKLKQEKSWQKYKQCLRHSPGHKNHFHVRIGKSLSEPGCTTGAQAELEPTETDENADDLIFGLAKND